MDALQSFMTPAEPVTVMGRQYVSDTDAVSELAKQFASKFTLAGLKEDLEDIISRGSNAKEQAIIRSAVHAAIKQTEQVEASSSTQVAVGGKRQVPTDPSEIAGGYAGIEKTETNPRDWVWMSSKGSQSGAVFYYLNDPYWEVAAAIMNSRIPRRFWEMQQDREGATVCNGRGVPVLVLPSESHLSREQIRVKNITMNPWRKETTYVDDLGDRVLNQYRPIKMPAMPEEKYFKIVEIAKSWLEFLYPGRSEYVLDHFSHMLRNLETKASTHLVLGGGQGIGKNVLLGLFTYTQNRQGKVSVIEKNQLTMPHTDYLMRPILIVDEFELRRGHANYALVKERLKAWTGSSEKWLAVHPKGKPATQVANIHRVIITTNNPYQIPRDNDDRRYAIMNSSVTEDQARELYAPLFAGLGYDVSHPEFSYNRLWEEGYGDAFAHFLWDRDYSEGFNPNKLPRDLLDQYDENTRGFEIPESMRLALDEIAVTFGRWLYIKEHGDAGGDAWPADVDKATPAHWPKFVAAQQLKGTHSAFFDEVDGETIRGSLNLETLCRNANYTLLQSDGAQWRGPAPTADADEGAVRVQTKLFVRRDAFDNGTTMEEKRQKAKEFVGLLTEYWRSAEGIEHYWTAKRVDEIKMKQSIRTRKKVTEEIDSGF